MRTHRLHQSVVCSLKEGNRWEGRQVGKAFSNRWAEALSSPALQLHCQSSLCSGRSHLEQLHRITEVHLSVSAGHPEKAAPPELAEIQLWGAWGLGFAGGAHSDCPQSWAVPQPQVGSRKESKDTDRVGPDLLSVSLAPLFPWWV